MLSSPPNSRPAASNTVPPGVFSVDSFDGVQRQDYAILDCEGATVDHGTLFRPG